MAHRKIDFNCIDCGIDTLLIREMYHVHDELWKQINPQNDGMICVCCCENRLGRQLRQQDFPTVELNWDHKKYPKSDRLKWRMINVG